MKNINNQLKNEAGYQSFIKDEKIKLTRMMCILSALLYGIFVLVDLWALPSALSSSIIIRSSVILILCVGYISTYHAKFNNYYSWILATTFFFAISGIEAMIYLSTPEDQAYNTYFAGIILVLIALFSWTHLKLLASVPLALLSIGGYTYIEVVSRGILASERFPALIANLFFLTSAVLIGLLAQLMRDNYLRKNYLLHQSLDDAFKEKTLEADDYEHQANHDALTGLPNRRYITALLEKSLEEAKEKDKLLLIMFIDLNGFKQINDVYGHAAGDEVLLIVAKRLELAVRKDDSLARLGGDEFLIGLLIDKENVSGVENIAEKFATIISATMNIENTRFKIGASIGVAAYPIHGNKLSVLMDIADKKMYQAKRGCYEPEKEDDEIEPVVIFPGNKRIKQS